MNPDIIEELSDLHLKCLIEARESLRKANITNPTDSEVIDAAASLFIGYIDRTSSRYKGISEQDAKGNNSDNPASEGQKGLIKTIVMEMGILGEETVAQAREMYGLEKKKDFAELNELKMGDAHLIIEMLKEAKAKKAKKAKKKKK